MELKWLVKAKKVIERHTKEAFFYVFLCTSLMSPWMITLWSGRPFGSLPRQQGRLHIYGHHNEPESAPGNKLRERKNSELYKCERASRSTKVRAPK